jgi:uncharacterized phage protein (TIGR02220 family)
MAYCADQENGGVIKNCADWNDRKWMQLVGVTYSEILSSCDLWSFKNESISVVFYPKEKELEVKAKRRAGKKGGRPPKTKGEKPYGLTELKGSKSEAETERNRKGKEEEVEGNKNKQTSVCAVFLSRFNETTGKNHRKLPAKAERQLRARLKDYSMDEIIKATDNASNSEHHRTTNMKHLTPELITRDDKLDYWLNASQEPDKTDEAPKQDMSKILEGYVICK